MLEKKRKHIALILFFVMTVGVFCFCCGCSTENFISGSLSLINQPQSSTDNTAPSANQTEGELNSLFIDKNAAMSSFSSDNSLLDKAVSSTAIPISNEVDSESQLKVHRVCDDYDRFLCSMCSSGVITREQWLTSLMYKLGIEKSTDTDSNAYDTTGTDISSYYNKALITTAVENGILSPTAEKYAPYRAATRQYVAYTLVNALSYSRSHALDCTDSEIITDKTHVASALYYGYFELDEQGCFNPHENITREEINSIFEVLDTVNKLCDKTILSFGDSIMYGSGNGAVGIADLIGDKYRMNVTDYSIGGATFGYVKNRSLIAMQIEKSIEHGDTADVILINGGTNDMVRSHFGKIIDGFDYKNSGCFNFCSGMEYALGLLREYYPNTPVIYIRSHNMQYSTEENEILYGETAIDICEKWGVSYVDMYTDTPFNADIMEIRDKYTANIRGKDYGDTVHPNKLGYYTFYLPITVKKMCELLG